VAKVLADVQQVVLPFSHQRMAAAAAIAAGDQWRRQGCCSAAAAACGSKLTRQQPAALWWATEKLKARLGLLVDDQNWQQTRPTGLTGRCRRFDRSVTL